MSNTVTRLCLCCKKTIQPRAADVARGWGRYCGKSCKAIAQTQKRKLK